MILAIIVFNITFILLVLLLFRRFSQEKAAVAARWHALIDKQGEKPSELFNVIDIIALRVGGSVAQHLQASMMGLKSVDAKMTKNMTTALTQDALAQEPGIIGMLASSPMAKGLIEKNEGYLPIALKLIGGLGQKALPVESDNGGSGGYQVT